MIFFGLLVALGVLSGCWRRQTRWMGYLEAEKVQLAFPIQGHLDRLDVQEGDQVEQGASLGRLVLTSDASTIEAKRHRVTALLWTLIDQIEGLHPLELEAKRKAWQAKKVQAEQLQSHWKRVDDLLNKQVISKDQWEEAKAQAASFSYQAEQLHDEWQRAKLGAGKAQLQVTLSKLDAEAWELQSMLDLQAFRQLQAPRSGYVAAVYVRAGSWVSSTKPILEIGVKPYRAVFYATAKELMRLPLGASLMIKMADGTSSAAKVIKVYTQAMFTPPIVYAEGDVDEYRYRIEASLEREDVHPGQPVEVILT